MFGLSCSKKKSDFCSVLYHYINLYYILQGYSYLCLYEACWCKGSLRQFTNMFLFEIVCFVDAQYCTHCHRMDAFKDIVVFSHLDNLQKQFYFNLHLCILDLEALKDALWKYSLQKTISLFFCWFFNLAELLVHNSKVLVLTLGGHVCPFGFSICLQG